MSPQRDEAPAGSEAMPPLLPPRPNLGPEPWRSTVGWPGVEWVVAGLVLLLIAAAVGVVRWRRSRRERKARAGSSSDPRASDHIGSAGDRRVSRAEALRDALIAAFGPSWGAKTTEEIAEEPELVSRIGPERAGEVVSLLAEADRAKFSGGSGEEEPSGDDDRLDASLAGLIAVLRSSAPGPGGEGRAPASEPKRRAAPV